MIAPDSAQLEVSRDDTSPAPVAEISREIFFETAMLSVDAISDAA